MENTFYSESERKGNFYFKREIKEEKHSLIPIAGNAIITWVGGWQYFQLTKSMNTIINKTERVCLR